MTSSVMSSHRGDGAHNPKPIPDLADPPRLAAHDRESRALERFIRDLIVEEFDGREPPSAVLQGLAEYVRAVDPKACRGSDAEPVTMRGMLSDARAAVDTAHSAMRKGDGATAVFLVGAARSQLGRVDERFRLPGLEQSRALLRRSDLELRLIEGEIRGHLPDASKRMQAWLRRWPDLKRALQRQEGRSFFSPRVLRRSLAS